MEMCVQLTALVAGAMECAVMDDRCRDRDVFLRELDRSIRLSAGFNLADLWSSSHLLSQPTNLLNPPPSKPSSKAPPSESITIPSKSIAPYLLAVLPHAILHEGNN
jgi:hypothetical protein